MATKKTSSKSNGIPDGLRDDLWTRYELLVLDHALEDAKQGVIDLRFVDSRKTWKACIKEDPEFRSAVTTLAARSKVVKKEAQQAVKELLAIKRIFLRWHKRNLKAKVA